MKRRFFSAVSAFLLLTFAGCSAPSTESAGIEPVALAPVPTIAPVLTVAPTPIVAPIPVATPTSAVKRQPKLAQSAPVTSQSLEETFPVQEATSSQRSSRRARKENSRAQTLRSSARRVERAATQAERAPVAEQGGQVWVNSNSDVYHMPGMRYYGKTRNGYYATEEQAQAAGFRRAMR